LIEKRARPLRGPTGAEALWIQKTDGTDRCVMFTADAKIPAVVGTNHCNPVRAAVRDGRQNLGTQRLTTFRLSDVLKLGVALALVVFAVAMLLMPTIWPRYRDAHTGSGSQKQGARAATFCLKFF